MGRAKQGGGPGSEAAIDADLSGLGWSFRPLSTVSVLLVEDDRVLVDRLGRGLLEDGYGVETERSYAGGFARAMRQSFDVIVLDIGLPDGNGVDLARALRRNGVTAPILMLTAVDEAASMVDGLDSGADDYVVKPVSLDVLAARLRALHRRAHRSLEAPLRIGGLVLEPSRLLARRGDTEIDLTPAQVDVLRALMGNVGNVLTRSQIDEHLRDGGGGRRSNVIDVHIRALRTKIDEPFGTDSIETVRGLGYRFRRPEA